MIVIKFGGTSVADGPTIERAAGIVRGRLDRHPIVVASAMAGVTDELAATPLPDDAAAFVERLRARHVEALDAVAPAGPSRKVAQERMTHLLEGLACVLDSLDASASSSSRPDPELRSDAILAHGELLSTTVLTAALESAGVPAVWVDAREVVVTDDAFGRAAPDFPEVALRARSRLGELASQGKVPVTQGFIGATADGITTTMGRGGSDFTAALLGAALGVEEVQIWTDVDGLMTADPRVVADARPLADATYDEAAELAYFGAKVLHPATMIPAIDANIPVRIRNTLDPEAAGTRISAAPGFGGGSGGGASRGTSRGTSREASRGGGRGGSHGRGGGGAVPQPGMVKSIASKRNVTTISLQAPRMLGIHGFLGRMFEIFERQGVSVDVVSTSEVSVSLSIENGAVRPELIGELEKLGRVEVHPDRAIICVVGEALRETPGIAARIFNAMAPLNIEMISQGASRINVTLVVSDVQAPEAVRRLHTEFFG